ncbi:MAG: DMT family transporter [Carboxylicivirga sp.]|jgi:transporter family protein|nr:DMT family transporter [Carboxylicivirga sp.]
MNGVIAQVLSMLSFGFSNALWRRPVGKMVVEEAIIYRTIFSLSFFVILLFTIDEKSTITIESTWGLNIWLFAFIISCISYFGLFFYNKALQYSTTGLVVIVVTTSFLFGQFTSFVLLGEVPTKGYILPFLLFIIAIVLSDYPSIYKLKLSKGVGYGLLASMFWGITLPLLSIPSKQIGYIKTGLVLEISVMLMSFLSLHIYHKKRMSYRVFKTDIRFFILLGLLAGCGVLFNNLSYTKISVYIASSISSSTHLISIIAAWIMFKEKLKPYQYLAAIVSVLAIFVLLQVT